MKQLYIVLFLLGNFSAVFAQNKVFTIKDVELGSRRELRPTDHMNLQWQGNSEYFTYQSYYILYRQSVTDSTSVKILTLKELNRIIQKDRPDTLSYIPFVTWENEHEFQFFYNNSWYAVNLEVNKLIASIKFPKGAENFEVFYPKKLVAYTLQNNVMISGADNSVIKITNDVNPDIVNGDIVSRNEFGINKGLFWSPNGNYLAFYRKDNSKIKNYPLVDINKREAEVKYIKYPMAGMGSEHVSLGIYSFAQGTSVFIEKDDTISEKYLTNISWDPNEKNIYIQVLNRQQNYLKLNSYKVSDGFLAKTLFEEKNNKYVEPMNPILFLKNTPQEFIYQSRRDGYNHAYLYDTEGNLKKQLTSGEWEITNILGLDDNDELYYLSTEETPIEQQAYKLNIKTSRKIKLTKDKGSHDLIISANFRHYLDKYSNTSVPNRIDVCSTSGTILRTAVIAPNPLSGFKMPEMSIGTIKAADGKTDLYYRIIKPTDFDPLKKYPAIVYVYGGPHVQSVSNRWLGGARLWDYMMAQKGYVVFTVDNRGSSNRGFAFESIIHRQCGVNEVQDQMEGVKFLKKNGFVDSSRIGVYGWSYGGFMSISLMVNYPEIFKTGIAGGPVIDWQYYEVMYGERYMDMPQENPDGYKNTSLISKAKDLKGKLLIIQGAEDPTVVWQNSLLFIQECIKNQKQVDYFVYPESEHNVRGDARVHLMEKITDYFDKNL
jgi:dipeptidyl-peptidase-4